MVFIGIRITDKERLDRIKRVFPDEQEALDILAYDKAVEQGKSTIYDLPPSKEKIAQKYTHTGTRQVKQATAYKFNTRQRQSNATKGGIIAELAEFLSKHSQYAIENCTVLNKERQIGFTIGDNDFELTLVQKRKSKK